MKRSISIFIVYVLIIGFSNHAFAVEQSAGGGGGGGQGSSQYKTIEVTDSQLEAGYTIDLSPGDRMNFQMEKNQAYVSVLSVFVNGAEMGVFANDRKMFYTKEHPSFSVFPNEQKFEMTEDNYYDLSITLNSASYDSKKASVTIKRINEKIPEGTTIYYNCWKYYSCSDGTKIKYCDYSNGVCGCRAVSSSECPQQKPQTCEKFYTCPNGKKLIIAP
jgi:hypothetical protein